MGLATLAVPAAAGAATVSVSGSTVTVTGGPESNDVGIGQGGDGGEHIYIEDKAGIVVGAGCQADPYSSIGAICGDLSTTSMVARLGDGDNHFYGLQNSIRVNWSSLRSIALTTGSGIDSIGPDALNGAPWTVDAGGGDDTITGSDEGDEVNGGAGDDRIDGYPGNDTVHGGPGDDTLTGNVGDDRVYGDEGDDAVNGSDGSDRVDGGAGKDHLTGDGSDQLSGDDTIDAADGERDVVSCGFGTDVANVDALDVVGDSNDCERVNRSHGAAGGKTRRPKPHPYRHHSPPVKRHTYRGKTSQGSKLTTGVGPKGKTFLIDVKYLTFRCQDGKSIDEAPVKLVARDKQKLARNGTVDTSISYDPSDGLSHEVVYIVAAFDGKKARGTLVGNLAWAGHGNCTSGKVGWTAK